MDEEDCRLESSSVVFGCSGIGVLVTSCISSAVRISMTLGPLTGGVIPVEASSESGVAGCKMSCIGSLEWGLAISTFCSPVGGGGGGGGGGLGCGGTLCRGVCAVVVVMC